MFRAIFVITISLLSIACNRPDPNPELRDPIYIDLKSELATFNQSLEGERKTLLENEKTLKEVIPQTGQNKYAQKRVDESKALIGRLEQETEYINLKILAQEKKARQSYSKAFKADQPWPDPAEWADYQAEKRLRNAKKTWDVKSRLKELGFSEND